MIRILLIVGIIVLIFLVMLFWFVTTGAGPREVRDDREQMEYIKEYNDRKKK